MTETKLAEETSAANKVKRSLDILQSGNAGTIEYSARIMGIVDSLRKFTRLDEGSRQKVDLHEGIDSALYLLKHDLGDRITVDRQHGDIPHVTCSASDLNQVFMHLLRNAVAAIDGSGAIKVRSRADAGKVQIDVGDSGVGMSAEQVQRAFDPTFTRSGTRARVGLGLFTSYGIVKQHDGEISIESRLGEGTTVTVTLPVV